MNYTDILQDIINKHLLNQKNGNRYFCERQIQFKLGLEIFKKINIEPQFERLMRGGRGISETLNAKRDYLDLFIEEGQYKTGIELKYKTTNKGKAEVIYEHHGAQSNGRAQCLFDISRLERFIDCNEITNGYFIFITNDKTYWSKYRNPTFSLSNEKNKTGVFKADWDSCPDYCNDFILRGKYDIEWIVNGSFGALLIPVVKQWT